MQIKVISLNIWDLPVWFVQQRKERVMRVAEYVIQSDVDIVCLQESFDPVHRRFLCDALKEKGYHVVGAGEGFRKVLFFKLFDTTGGLVTFSKFPILSSRFVPWKRRWNTSLPELLGKKGFLETTVRTPRGILTVINTHLHHETPFFDRVIRVTQLAWALANTNHVSTAAILAGDLNQHAIHAQERFVDMFASHGFTHPLRSEEPSYRPENVYVDIWANRTKIPKRFDYILVKNLDKLALHVIEYRPDYVMPPLSDHDPIVLTLAESKV